MDWESKFSSIVRETESNLEKVKRRLGAARASSNLALGLNSSMTSNLSSNDKSFRMDSYHRSADTSYLSNGVSYKSFYHSPAHKSSAIGDHTLDATVGSNGLLDAGRDQTLPLESSPGVILVLQEKLDTQAKAIDNLTKTVHRLTEEKDLYYKQMKVLRDEVTLLKSRVTEKGVDLQTERKLQLWKQEMMSEMQMLQHQINMQKTRKDETLNSSLYDGHASSLIKEMQDLKRFIQNDCDMIRRDIDSVKSRIVKAEVDLGSVLTDIEGLGRQSYRLSQSLREVSDSQLSTHHNLSRSLQERDQQNQDISALRKDLHGLQDRVNHIPSSRSKQKVKYSEYRSPHSASTKQRKETSTHAMKTTGQSSQYYDGHDTKLTSHDIDLDLSDADLGDLDLHSTEFSLSSKDQLRKTLDTEDELELLDTADLNLSSDGLSTDGDTLDLDELK